VNVTPITVAFAFLAPVRRLAGRFHHAQGNDAFTHAPEDIRPGLRVLPPKQLGLNPSG
jgi:hypothetical protein